MPLSYNGSTPLGVINRAAMGMRRVPHRFARRINRDVDLLKRRLVFDSTTSVTQPILQPCFSDDEEEDDSLIQSLDNLDIFDGKSSSRSMLCHSTPMNTKPEIYTSTPNETRHEATETFHPQLQNVEENDQAETLNPNQELDLDTDPKELSIKDDLQEPSTDVNRLQEVKQDEFSENLNTLNRLEQDGNPDSYLKEPTEQTPNSWTEEQEDHNPPESEKDIDTNRLTDDTNFNAPNEDAEFAYYEERDRIHDFIQSSPILYNLIQTASFPFATKHKYQFGNSDETNEENDFQEENIQPEAPVVESEEIYETEDINVDLKKNISLSNENFESNNELLANSRYTPQTVSYEQSAHTRSEYEAACSSLNLETDPTTSVCPSPDLVCPSPDLVCPSPDLVCPSPDLVSPSPGLVSPSPGLVARLGCSKARLRCAPQRLFKTSPVNFEECLEIVKRKEEERLKKLKDNKPLKMKKPPLFSIYSDALVDEEGNEVAMPPLPVFPVNPEEAKKKKQAEEEKKKRQIKLKEEQREIQKNFRKARNLVDILSHVLR